MTELRCESRILFGILEDSVLQVKCRSAFCAEREPGVVVIHLFDVRSGDLLATRKFRDPATKKGK